MRSWSKTVSVTCGGIQYTYAGGGSTVVTVLMQGTATFTGTGTFSGSMTEWGDINQTASNNTVTIKCTGNPNQPYTTNSGNPVYNTPETLTVSGTYTITSSGIGTMTVNLEGVEPMNLILGELSSTGVTGFVMMRQIESNDEVDSFGVLMLKSN